MMAASSASARSSLVVLPRRARTGTTWSMRGGSPVVLSQDLLPPRRRLLVTEASCGRAGRGGSTLSGSYYHSAVAASGCIDGVPPAQRLALLDRRCGRRRLRRLHHDSRQQRWHSTASNANDERPLLLGAYDLTDPDCNVPHGIASKMGIQLHRQRNHPLQIITSTIHKYFQNLEDVDGSTNNDPFPLLDDLSPVVTTNAAFDSLRIPVDHPSRSRTDTYYVSRDVVLRPHTSAHQVDLLKDGCPSVLSSSLPTPLEQFLVAGDVYRRDEIDKSHYPVFHQMEGVKLFHNARPDAVQKHLQQTLEGLARHLFGDDVPMRWVDAYFPFTHPSHELEIHYDGTWMEVLGCGVIHPQVLLNAGRVESLSDAHISGWAFGLGLERLAMVLFNIPDIRLFWSTDDRFLSQFTSGHIVQFQPYSKYPPVYKDVSFWLPDSTDGASGATASTTTTATATAFHSNDVYEVIRNVGGDWIEQVCLLDEFVHPATGRVSHCYRVTWRSMDRNLTNEEIDALQSTVREQVSQQLGAELR